MLINQSNIGNENTGLPLNNNQRVANTALIKPFTAINRTIENNTVDKSDDYSLPLNSIEYSDTGANPSEVDDNEFYPYHIYLEGFDGYYGSDDQLVDGMPKPPEGYKWQRSSIPTATEDNESQRIYYALIQENTSTLDPRLDTTTKMPTWRWRWDSYAQSWEKEDLPEFKFDPYKETRAEWANWEYEDWDKEFFGSRLIDQPHGIRQLNKFILDRAYDLGWAFSAIFPFSVEEDNKGRLLPDTLEFIAEKLYTNPEYVKAMPFGVRHAVRALLDKGVENGQTVYEASENAGDIVRDAIGATMDYYEQHGAATYFGGAESQIYLGMSFNRKTHRLIAKIEADKKLSEIIRNKVTPEGAFLLESEAARVADEKAAKIAEENVELQNKLIREFEEVTGRKVSIQKEDGNLEIDYTVARKAGEDAAKDMAGKTAQMQVIDVNGNLVPLFKNDEQLINPLVTPEKFKNLLAVVAELKQKNPDAFNPNNKVIDDLIKLTISKDLLGSPELIGLLNKYNVSFEDFILAVSYSGSVGGRLLGYLSAMKRTRGFQGKQNVYKKELEERASNNGTFMKGVRRFETARRGGLVSQLATTSRNLTSFHVRMPAEALGNLMDNFMFELGQHGLLSSSKKLLTGKYNPSRSFRDSFRVMKYLYSGESAFDAKGWVDYMMKNPDLKDINDTLFNTLNEIRKVTKEEYATPTGKAFDKFMNEYEMVVDTLNVPNLWQDHLTKRASFLSEAERLIRREWDLDLIEDILKQGKLKEAISDSTTLRPEKARSFMDILLEAQDKAMEVTYGKQPDVWIFREISNLITQTGLTAVINFPRFMFNSMEILGQYAGGAFLPLFKTVFGRNPLKYTKDRRAMANNLIGWSMAMAAYEYRKSEDAPEDYKMINVGEDVVMDVTPQFFLRPFLWVGEAIDRAMNGTLDQWDNMGKEFAETFIGTNYRVGVINDFVANVRDGVFGEDVGLIQRGGKLSGEIIGNYVTTILVPLGQAVEFDRAVGIRGTQYKEMRENPEILTGERFRDKMSLLATEAWKGFKSKQKRLFMSPETEADLAPKEYVFGRKYRVSPLSRLLLGANLSTSNLEDGEYLQSLGFAEYDLGSKSFVPDIRNEDNAIIRDIFLPVIVSNAKNIYTPYYKNRYNGSPKLKNTVKQTAYVNGELRNYIKEELKRVRREIGKYQKDDRYTQFFRLPKELRARTLREFYVQYQTDFRPDNKKHMITFLELAKELR